MKTYIYRALIEPGEEREWVVSFPDVPEAVSQAETVDDARCAAQEALGLALLSYPARGKPLPERLYVGDRHPTPSVIDIAIAAAPDVTAKLAVLEAMTSSGRSAVELEGLLSKDRATVQAILDPMHPTDLHILVQALEVLGHRLVVGVTDIDEAA